MDNQKFWKPLKGIKVVDFSIFLPGPLTAQILADLGAEVIKVESPAGDPARDSMPTLFKSANRSKRSVILDLKSDTKDAAIQKLAQWADIVVEGFRPGVAARLGISFEDMRKHNPALVYCSLSGYGQTGPWKDKPGHDLNYLAASGALAFPGTWDSKPARSSLPIADISGTGLATSAVLAALYETKNTGQGSYLDLSLFESCMFNAVVRHGLESDRNDRSHVFPGNDFFETSDNYILTLGLLEDHFWNAFCERVADIEPKVLSENYKSIPDRRSNGDELTKLLRSLVARFSKQEWDQFLSNSDVPFEFAVLPSEALNSEHSKARNRAVNHGSQQYTPFPVTVNGNLFPESRSEAPELGEFTDDFFNN